MQITFDPLIAAEADAVLRLLGGLKRGAYAEVAKEAQEERDARKAGKTIEVFAGMAAEANAELAPSIPSFLPGDQSAAPAPSDAVAAQSPTAPEAPPVSVPPPPIDAAAPATAPTAPPAPAAPSSPAPSVDVTGLPWDERIHAANKATNTDGRWRKKKGLNDGAFVGQVEAELRMRAAGGAAPTPPAPPAPPTIEQAAAAAAAAVSAPSVPPVPPTPPAPPVTPPAPPAPDVMTFGGLMEWVTPLMTTGKLSFPTVSDAVKEVGLNVLSDMAQPQNAAKVPEVYALLAPKVPK